MSKPIGAFLQAVYCGALVATFLYTGAAWMLGIAVFSALFTTWYMIDTAGEE